MFDVSKFVTIEPARWEYELPSDWQFLPDLFHYFGVSEVTVLIEVKQTKFVLNGRIFLSDNDEFGNPLWVAREVVGMLNSTMLFIDEYVYFYVCNDTSIQITKISLEEYEAEKPPFSLGKGQWDLYFKDPTDTKVSIRDLPPECYLVF